MASTLSFELRRADGTPADPTTTIAPSWQAGNLPDSRAYSPPDRSRV